MKCYGLVALVAALVLLVGCTGRPNDVEPVSPFDINRYQGVWYEIMRLDHSFERGLTNVTATYNLRDDGTVGVLNRGFDRDKCRWKEANGTAKFQVENTVASLSVTFFWPFALAITCLRLTRTITDTPSLQVRRMNTFGYWRGGPICRPKSGTT